MLPAIFSGQIRQLINGGLNAIKAFLESQGIISLEYSYGQWTKNMNIIMISAEELDKIKSTQLEILQQLKQLLYEKSALISPKDITAKEFMEVVRICRSRFDQ